MTKYYKLGDKLAKEDLEKFGLNWRDVTIPMPSCDHFGDIVKGTKKKIKAKWSGEKRPPKAGEWYLSGAIPAAYRAPNDFTSEYHIAKLVIVETRTFEHEPELREI